MKLIGMANRRMEEIAWAVADYYEVPIKDLLGPSKPNRIAHVRFLAIYLMRELTDLTLAEIAFFFRRDHTTIIHAERRAREMISGDEELTAQIKIIRNEITTCEKSDRETIGQD